MTTNPLHLVINGRCSWCEGPHELTPLTMTIDDITETRAGHTTSHMHWPVDEDTRRRLAAVVKSDKGPSDGRLRRLLRWLTRTR